MVYRKRQYITTMSEDDLKPRGTKSGELVMVTLSRENVQTSGRLDSLQRL